MGSSRDDAPDPTTEPDAGPVGGGGPDEPSSGEQAQNAEVVPDPDAEPGDHEPAAADRVDRLERHNRSSSTGT
jgi:hypothetical protein